MIHLTALEKMADLLQPRRQMKYVLVWCAAGSATFVVDEQELELQANEVITITSGQIHYLKKTDGARGWVLEFTYAFFCKDDSDIELIFHNSLFCHFAMNEIIPLSENERVGQLLQEMEGELREKLFQYPIAVHSRIKLILVEINRAKLDLGGAVYKPDALFLRFLERVKGGFEQNLRVAQIADALGTTPAKLNELSRLHTGKTAQHVIYGLIASEAKRLFTYEKLSVKEVAYRLGFSDPFYFSNFFKKHTKYAPKSYREKFAI